MYVDGLDLILIALAMIISWFIIAYGISLSTAMYARASWNKFANSMGCKLETQGLLHAKSITGIYRSRNIQIKVPELGLVSGWSTSTYIMVEAEVAQELLFSLDPLILTRDIGSGYKYHMDSFSTTDKDRKLDTYIEKRHLAYCAEKLGHVFKIKAENFEMVSPYMSEDFIEFLSNECAAFALFAQRSQITMRCIATRIKPKDVMKYLDPMCKFATKIESFKNG